MNKFYRNSEGNNSDYSKSKSSSDKNPKYNNLHFYGKDGFITFIQNYSNIFNYRNIFFDEAFNSLARYVHKELNLSELNCLYDINTFQPYFGVLCINANIQLYKKNTKTRTPIAVSAFPSR